MIRPNPFSAAQFSVLLFTTLLTTSCTSPRLQEQPVPASSSVKPGVTRSGEVYLMRGLANVFSTGMDGLGSKMRAKGMNVKVTNHSAWQAMANDIVRRSKQSGAVSYPIIIMGHSFGADASAKMATHLGKNGVKVAYVVSFDPSSTNYVGPNISKVTNYYASSQDGAASNNIILKGPGFRGRLENINVGKNPQYGVHHFNIDKSAKIHASVISQSYRLTRALR